MNAARSIVIIGLCLNFWGCSRFAATAPDFYPNNKYLDTPEYQRQSDERECTDLAKQYLKDPNKYQNMAEEAAIHGGIGAATGAAGGAFWGEAGRAAGAGAAVGAVVGIVQGLQAMNDHHPSYERFVGRCLQQKGYEVIGWSRK